MVVRLGILALEKCVSVHVARCKFCGCAVYSSGIQDHANSILYADFVEELIEVLELPIPELMVS